MKENTQSPLSTLACNLDISILQATLPLFQAAEVEAIEWSFDALFKQQHIPDWFQELLGAFSNEKRLIGHGVFFSLFSGKWATEQQDWLGHLKATVKQFPLDHVTEHFGFMTGKDFHKGAPLAIPYTRKTIALGQDRLKRISEAAQCPVGLENLAFAYSIDDVRQHGDFLEQLLSSVNGFMILDLHNLYCQIHNFEYNKEDILALYSLDLVREIHISGGSWESTSVTPEKKIRRDTHDDSVPESVFDLLKYVLPLCPNLKYVVLEQLGTALKNDLQQLKYQEDFAKMKMIIKKSSLASVKAAPLNDFLSKNLVIPNTPMEDQQLWEQQLALSNILETAKTYHDAKAALKASILANTSWKVENWQASMVETALAIAQKWK